MEEDLNRMAVDAGGIIYLDFLAYLIDICGIGRVCTWKNGIEIYTCNVKPVIPWNRCHDNVGSAENVSARSATDRVRAMQTSYTGF